MNTTLLLLVCAALKMGTAYRLDFSGFMHVNILDNEVHTLYHGMDLRFNDGAQQVLVQGNDITFGSFDCSSACPSYSGINVAEGNLPALSSMIKGNTIRYSEGLPSRYGISLLAANNWLVVDNTLLMEDNISNLYGVLLDGCTRTEVSCNTITSELNTWINDRQAAIRNFMGSDPLISCNYMDRTTNGILFNFVAPNTEVRGNHFHNHQWPLHLDTTAVIGLQERKGNLWYPTLLPPALGAWYENSDNAPIYPFLYNPDTVGGGITTPPSVWPPSGWFNTDLGPNYDCAEDEDYCSQFRGRGKERLTELDKLVAIDSLANDPFTDETKWILKSRLYKKLDENPELQDSLQTMGDFYDDLQGSTTAAFKTIDDDQVTLYSLDSTVVMQLHANRAEIEAIREQVKDDLEELGDSTLTAAQRQAILASISGYRQSVRELSIENATALQSASSSKVLRADSVQTANAGVVVSEVTESNQKEVNDIYLATIGKDVDDITEEQVAALFDIANQCPMLGGNAVFKARSLYWLIDERYNFDDASICLPYGIVVKRLSEQHANTVNVVPNPASDEASLVVSRETVEPAYLTLYNTVGSEVLRVFVPKGVVRHGFSTANIAPGLYHFKVLSGDGLIGDGKLTIVR